MTEMDLRPTSMAPSGEAVAHYEQRGERRAVLVRGGAPGELVRARVDTSQRPARGEITLVVEPSPSRVSSPCAFVDACGGCDWMHLSPDARAEHHRALAAFVHAPVTFHAAKRELGYRTRARFHAKNDRVGYFGARSHSLVRVETCVVLDPRIDATRATLEPLLAGARGDGEISLALGANGVVAEVRWSRELPPEVFARLEKTTAFQGVRVLCGEARRPAIFGDPAPTLKAADGAPLELPPGGFAQAHEEVNAELASCVAERARGSKRLLELYAGAGNFTVLLARDADVRAVESNEQACEAARRNLAARSLSAKVTCADAATFDIPAVTDTVVLDPPRTGARDASERIAKTRSVKRVVYVSCDRGTLARDLAILAAAFEPKSADVFDMFPNTSHAEMVVLLQRENP
jgi:23S rRNA (uracil1939-C5)-methyltransferase